MDEQMSVFDFLEYRILTHYQEALQLLDGKMPAPRTAIVYPTYCCNQNCQWCEYAEDNREINQMMTEEQLHSLLRGLRDLGVRGVEFCGGGEPTLHPALAGAVREMKANGVSTGVLTNGTRLRGELASALADCASYVRVGFDSANAETFNKVKRPKTSAAGFDAVCENVRNLVALRDEKGTGLVVSMKVILSSENYTEIEQCVDLACRLKVNSIQFKAARLCDTELNEEQAAQVQIELVRVREMYPSMAVVGGVKKLNMTRQCWLTPLQIMVDTLGDVFLCCYYRHRKDAHRFGNAFTENLRDVWYGQRHWEAIRRINPAECNLLDCRFVHYNRIMTQLLVEHDAQFEFI